ncbi:MAG: hypothetical protein RSG92_27430 [Pseudomonas sp.]
MIDREKLKALAENLIKVTDQVNEEGNGNTFDDAWSIADDHYVEASGPEVVLALLAEIERLELIGRISCNLDSYKAVLDERDQLKAERDLLREDRNSLLESGGHLL